MLVLTRHLNQSLQVGEAITLKILSINNGNIRFGIEAPPDVLILREELVDRINASPSESVVTTVKKQEPRVTYKPRRKKLVIDR